MNEIKKPPGSAGGKVNNSALKPSYLIVDNNLPGLEEIGNQTHRIGHNSTIGQLKIGLVA